MELRELKKGDKIYATYSFRGFLGYCDVYECIVTKIRTKDFVTVVYFNDQGKRIGKKAVGYYLGNCALNEDYYFSCDKEALGKLCRAKEDSDKYNQIISARNRIMKLIES